MLTRLFLSCAFLLASLAAGAQNFTGTWYGNLTQEMDPPFHNYRIRLDLKQVDDVVSGVSHIHLPDSLQIFAEMEFRGVVKDGKLYFKEPRLLDSHHFSEWDWCLKRGILTFKDIGGIKRMEGFWEGFVGTSRCTPGRIVVEQGNLRPDPLARNKSLGPAVKNAEKAKPRADKWMAAKGDEPPAPDYGALEGRRITRQATVEVSKPSFTAYIWDANKEDGDVVSLQFNGVWILRDFTLKNAKEPIRLELKPGGDNRLILYAENMGRIPPNTCALTFHDGQKMRTLSLVSDEVSCGALRFELRD